MTAIDHQCPTCHAWRGRPCHNLHDPKIAKTRPHKGRVFGISDGTTVEVIARRIVLRELLVADLQDSAWRTSLMLILSDLDRYVRHSTGAILVPMAPHMGGRWINGVAPGVTVEAILVRLIDCEPIDREVARLNDVLFPNHNHAQEATTHE